MALTDLGQLLIRLTGDSSKFEKMIRGAEGRMARFSATAVGWGKELTKFVTAPLVGLGVAVIRSARGVQAAGLNRDLRLLNRDAGLLGRDLAKILIPPLREFITLLRRGILWVRSISDDKKKWAVVIGAVAAALGPVLTAVGLLGPLIVTLGSGFASLVAALVPAAAAAGVFFAKMTLIAGAVLVVTGLMAVAADAFLQFFGVANLGILDMVKKYTESSNIIGKAWDVLLLEMHVSFEKWKGNIIKGWKSLFLAYKEMNRKQVSDVINVAEKAWKALSFVGRGFGGESLKGLMDQQTHLFADARRSILDESRDDFKKYVKDISDMESQLRHKRKVVDDITAMLFKGPEPILNRVGRDFMEEAQRMIKGIDLGKMWDGLAGKLGLGDIQKWVDQILDRVRNFKFPGLPDLKRERERPTLSTKEFETMSLRRFSLETPGARQTKEQEVRAVGVEKRLDSLVEIQKTQTALIKAGFPAQAAILG